MTVQQGSHVLVDEHEGGLSKDHERRNMKIATDKVNGVNGRLPVLSR